MEGRVRSKIERRYRSLGRKAAKRVDAAIGDMVVAEGVRDARDCKGRITVGGTMSHVFARSVGRSYRIRAALGAAACAFCGRRSQGGVRQGLTRLRPGRGWHAAAPGLANANAIWAEREREGARSRQPAGSKSRAGGGGGGMGVEWSGVEWREKSVRLFPCACACGPHGRSARQAMKAGRRESGSGGAAAAGGAKSPACPGNSGPKGAGGAARPPPKPPTGAPCGRAP